MLAWIALSVFVAAALALDLRAGPRSALLWSVVWTGIGVAFAGVIAWLDGGDRAGEYLAGFLIEKSLSLDNLFVFAVLFATFGIPAADRRRVLVLGVAGAIVLRVAFILAGAAALDAVHQLTYALGALLLVTAVRIARHGGEEMDPEKTRIMRLLRRTRVSPAVGALLMIAAFDVMFAIDSIPAIFAITRDTFVVFAANAFSLLGMVSLYFLLEGLMDRFRYLHLGLAAILAFVGVKLVLVDVWHPPIVLSLGVVVLSLAVAAVASAAAERSAAQRVELGVGADVGRVRHPVGQGEQ